MHNRAIEYLMKAKEKKAQEKKVYLPLFSFPFFVAAEVKSDGTQQIMHDDQLI